MTFEMSVGERELHVHNTFRRRPRRYTHIYVYTHIYTYINVVHLGVKKVGVVYIYNKSHKLYHLGLYTPRNHVL